MAASTNGQVGLKKGSLDPTQRKKFYAGKNFEYNGSKADIWQGSYNQIPSSAFDMLGMMNNEVTGIKGFSGGINGNGLGSSATAARGVLDATSVRRLDLVRNLAENLIKPLMRKWMSYNSEFLSDEEVIRVTSEEFVEVRRDDLAGKIDIDITISTAEDNAAKSQELSFLLQTLGNSVPFELTQKVLGKIARLSRMPDLEKELLEFKPEPDPMEQQVKQLEIKKLQAEIAAIKADTRENLGDEAEKFAKAEKIKAETQKIVGETEKIGSEKDLNDLKFIKEDEQIDASNKREDDDLKHRRELEKAEQTRLINLEAMQYQAANNDKNIGVVRGNN